MTWMEDKFSSSVELRSLFKCLTKRNGSIFISSVEKPLMCLEIMEYRYLQLSMDCVRECMFKGASSISCSEIIPKRRN